MRAASRILTARFVAPVDGPVIQHGSVVVAEGRIVNVGPASDFDQRGATDFGDALIAPGFVNAHTHLELSLLAGRIPPQGDLIDWLRRLVTELSLRSGVNTATPRESHFPSPRSIASARPDERPNGHGNSVSRAPCPAVLQQTDASPIPGQAIQAAVRAGIDRSLQEGVTTVGDVTRWPEWTRPILAESPLRFVSFGEVVSIGRRRAPNPHDLARTRLEAMGATSNDEDSSRQTDRSCRSPWALGRATFGLSPHSPYTVEPNALRACAEVARRAAAPLCIHLLESPHEDAFTRRREGRFVDFLRSIGVWDDAIPVAGLAPLELVEAAGLLGPRTILAHVNYPNGSDLAVLAASRANVAYCPRTHRAFGHPPHAFRAMLEAGINVCVGTDSLATNPSLSILDELRWLRTVDPSFSAAGLLALGTLRGSVALGFGGLTGSLAVGKCADLAVIPLETGAAPRWESVFESDRRPLAVFAAGQSVGAA